MNLTIKDQPIKIQRRLDLFAMFSPLERKYERRWAKLFMSDFNTKAKKFKELSIEKGYKQEEVNQQLLLWRNPKENSAECMFYFINNVSDFSSVYNCFKYIEQYKVFLTYAIVHQKKDGENDYDIFRFSHFSYLEHCNRVRYPIKNN